MHIATTMKGWKKFSMAALPQILCSADDFCVLRTEIVDKLLKCSDGDGALLYLYVLRQGKNFNEKQAMRDLGFSAERYSRAIFTLTSLEIAQETEQPQPPQKPKPPVYQASELRQARTSDHRFSAVCQSAESVLGRPLTDAMIRCLYTIYDYLGLPAEVIIELLSYLKREKQEIKRSDIAHEAALWADMGLFSAQAAAEYLNRREAEKPLLETMRAAVGLPQDRALSAAEQRALSKYIACGFPPESVQLAAQRMQAKIGTFKWSYLSKILESWDAKGVHTLSEITALEPESKTSPYYASMTAAPTAPAAQQPALSDWDKQWLAQLEAHRKRQQKEGR